MGFGKKATVKLAETRAQVKNIPSKIDFEYFFSTRGERKKRKAAFAQRAKTE